MVKAAKQLELMRQSGHIAALALRKAISEVRVGLSLLKLDRIIEMEIIKNHGQPAFKTVPGYRFASCLSLNDEVVHSVPNQRKLKDSDLLSIDLGVIFEGWYTDTAWTVVVGKANGLQEKFLKVGEEAMWAGIKSTREGLRVGDISSSIQTKIEEAGYFVVRSLVGHGVGRSYHEAPEIPGFGKSGQGILLKSGMTLAIEAIYAEGTGEVKETADGWTIVSADGSLAGMFEMTVIVGKEPEVITDWRKISL